MHRGELRARLPARGPLRVLPAALLAQQLDRVAPAGPGRPVGSEHPRLRVGRRHRQRLSSRRADPPLVDDPHLSRGAPGQQLDVPGRDSEPPPDPLPGAEWCAGVRYRHGSVGLRARRVPRDRRGHSGEPTDAAGHAQPPGRHGGPTHQPPGRSRCRDGVDRHPGARLTDHRSGRRRDAASGRAVHRDGNCHRQRRRTGRRRGGVHRQRSEWKPATGLGSWSCVFTPTSPLGRGSSASPTDDSANIEVPAPGRQIQIGPRPLPASIWSNQVVPTVRPPTTPQRSRSDFGSDLRSTGSSPASASTRVRATQVSTSVTSGRTQGSCCYRRPS